MEEPNQYATMEPFHTAEACFEALKSAFEAAYKGSPASISDAGLAAFMARAGFGGAMLNVKIKLPGVDSEEFKSDLRTRMASLHDEFGSIYVETHQQVTKVLNELAQS